MARLTPAIALRRVAVTPSGSVIVSRVRREAGRLVALMPGACIVRARTASSTGFEESGGCRVTRPALERQFPEPVVEQKATRSLGCVEDDVGL